MKKLRWLILPILVLAVLGGFGAIQATRATQELPKVETVTEAPKEAEKPKEPEPTVANGTELFILINAERANAGVHPLEVEPLLNSSALLKAQDMLSYDYFGHVNPKTGKNGPTFITDVGLRCYYQSENIYFSLGDKSAKDAVKWWMESPSHKAAILDPRYESMGFGVVDAGDNFKPMYAVNHFCDKG